MSQHLNEKNIKTTFWNISEKIGTKINNTKERAHLQVLNKTAFNLWKRSAVKFTIVTSFRQNIIISAVKPL